MPERFKVLIHPQAHTKFALHVEYLSRVSESAADRLYGAYTDSCVFLNDAPESCPLYTLPKNIDAELRYKLFGKRYRIVFEIIGDAVYVYDIQDCRQDSDKNLV